MNRLHTDLSNLSMMDLFRMEAANLTDGMTTALIDLESHPGDSVYLQDLMRAAHSLKGAARIVGVDPLVALGHAMEDRLTGAQKQASAIARVHVDALLQGTDLFARIVQTNDAELPAWLASQQPTFDRLIALLQSDAVPALEAKVLVGEPIVEVPPLEEVAARRPEPAGPVAAPVLASGLASGVAVSSAPMPVPDAAPRSAEAPAAPGRHVRLEAVQLESLLGLARESLLVNRSHQRQETQLQSLRAAQRQVAVALEHLDEALRQGLRPEQLQATLEAALLASRRGDAVLAAHMHDHAGQTRRGHRIATRLHHTINTTRMTRFGSVAASLKRLARDTGQRVGKEVVLHLEGAGTQLDRDVLERIEAPLGHMVRNAIDHGLEDPAGRQRANKTPAGHITVMARHHRGQLEVTVRDDGRGVDLDRLRERILQRGLSSEQMLARMSEDELLAFLFLPGFSTRDVVSETSGRGVGLDVVETCVQGLRGRLRVANQAGQGLAITLVLPVSLSLVRALLLQVAHETYALPLSQLERVVTLPTADVRWVAGQPCITVDGRDIGWMPLGPILGVAPPQPSHTLTLIEIATAHGRFALSVDKLLGERDLALQAFDARLIKPVHVSAAAVLDDGAPVLVLDVADLASSVSRQGPGTHQPALAMAAMDDADEPPSAAFEDEAEPELAAKRVLVVEDSFTVREVERKVLTGGGYDVDVAVDGVEGWNAVCHRRYDLVVTDIDMPRMNGLELLRRIRANESTARLPVMIVSYKDREEDRMAGLEAGADRYFVKSGFEESALLEAAADLIGRSS